MIYSISKDYIDRTAEVVKKEKPFAGKFLNWSYNTTFGRLLTRYILSRKAISQAIGWITKFSLSRFLIDPFIRSQNISMNLYVVPTNGYRSFHEFFTRKLKKHARNVDLDPNLFISPADGKIFVIPKIRVTDNFPVKRNIFNLTTFLNDQGLANKYQNGSLAVIRLMLSDYHHFHFPCTGIPRFTKTVNGRLFAGASYNRTSQPFFYAENQRTVTEFETNQYGTVLICEVGAFTVGSIQQVYNPNEIYYRGDSKGYFEPGGSTIVLVFKKNAITFDKDLIINSYKQIETVIKCGERIGYKRIKKDTV